MTGRTTAPIVAASEMRGRRRRNLLLAVALPVLLAIAYLAGMSGAGASERGVPALIVNNDQMVEQVGVDGTSTPVVAGRLLVTHLVSPEYHYGFDWQLADAATADVALASGDATVVVTIPENFSAAVVSLGTNAPQQAELRVATDQSHDYLSPQAARELANAVVAEFGTDLTEQVAIGLVQGMDATGAALQQAADGAGQLAAGAGELGAGFDTYTAGQQQLADGLAQSADGATQLADGVTQYTAGVDQFAAGAAQYVDGASTFAGGVTQYTAGVGQFTSGVTQYTAGVDQFADGVTQYTDGVDQLAEGLAQLETGAAPLTDAAEQIDGALANLGGVATDIESAQAYYETQIKPGLDQIAGDASTLAAYCDELADPASQRDCRAAAGELSSAAGSASGFIDGIFSDTEGIGQISTGIDQLGQLSSGLRQLAGGISQSADGAAQLSAAGADLDAGAAQVTGGGAQLGAAIAQLTTASSQLDVGASQLVSGGAALTSGAAQLQAGGAPLSSGASDLASGLGQLRDGQAQLMAGNAPLRDGMTGLADGATQLQQGLQEGADRASGALGDPEEYAGVLAHPVVANVDARHDPGYAGLLATLALPIAAWAAAFITSLARRLLTREGLASTASTGRLVWRAALRLGTPVLAATVAVGIIGHIAGAPWVGLVGTLTIGVLLAAAVTALHLLFVALWGRRGGAIASLALLLVQLAALRGLVPLELRASWMEVLASISPLSHAAAGLQLVYAGGSAGAIVMSLVSLALVTLVAAGAAWLTIDRSRRLSLGQLVNLRARGLPLRAPDPVGV